MEYLPLEVYRRIISMIDDEEEISLSRPDKDSSPSATASVEASPSIFNNQGELPTNGTRGPSSVIAGSAKNMQRKLQNRLAVFWKLQLLTLISKVYGNMHSSAKIEASDSVPKTTVNRLATLKSLRLCNKKFAVATAEFVFEEVLLRFTEESHAKLEAISQHTYRSYVRVLHIIPKSISGPLLPKKEFDQWLRGARTLIDNPVLYAGQYHTGLLVMPDYVILSRKAINLHYKEYKSLHTKQQKLFSTAGSVLQAAIGRFPRLKRVESGLYWDGSRKRQEIPPHDFEPSPGWYWQSKRLYTSARDDMIDRVWKTGACQTDFDTDQGAMILRAIAHGRAISGARIDAGCLFRDLNKMILQTADPIEQAMVNTLTADTKHLNFYFNLADVFEMQSSMSSGRISTMLQAMTRLESVRFQCPCLGMEDRLVQTFGNSITWPHLTFLSVKDVDRYDFDGLAAMIYRHKGSLRQLTLYEVRYFHEDEYALCADLSAGALDRIRIWKLNPEVAKRLIANINWQSEAHGWANSVLKHEFSAGAWSPRLTPDIREEIVANLFPSFAPAQTGLLAVGRRVFRRVKKRDVAVDGSQTT